MRAAVSRLRKRGWWPARFRRSVSSSGMGRYRLAMVQTVATAMRMSMAVTVIQDLPDESAAGGGAAGDAGEHRERDGEDDQGAGVP